MPVIDPLYEGLMANSEQNIRFYFFAIPTFSNKAKYYLSEFSKSVFKNY